MKSARFLCVWLAVGWLVSFGASSSWAVGSAIFSDGYYNLGSGGFPPDNTLTILNSGASNASLCANIYMFDAKQDMLSCCSCLLSQNGLLTLSVINLLGGTAVRTGAIEVISSSTPCNATSVTPAPELDGWVSHLVGTSATTEQALTQAELSAGELSSLATACNSVHHVCSCPPGFN
jgi:hypothetical protein